MEDLTIAQMLEQIKKLEEENKKLKETIYNLLDILQKEAGYNQCPSLDLYLEKVNCTFHQLFDLSD